ncbi:hypothetical protein [Haloarcula marina]|uniref:hypothetical protein n=1 Tax=Haloarcula marina TaxID=2961574 RepID=UPI0020B8A2BF|nr:hypothetical protein [Halomicroarcula marina]
MPTENRDYNLPQEGDADWHVPVNENWQLIDADVQAALEAAQEALDAATSDTSDSTDGSTSDTTDDSTTDSTTGGTGFTWDQTHVDTSWLTDAAVNDTLNVEKVTSLDLEGSGSITEAVQNGGSDPTVIVFEVGGVIDIGGGPYWRMEQPNTYIAGQTAPSPGISMIRGGPRLEAENVIVEHMSFFCGDDVNDTTKAGAVTIDEQPNVLLNHCTAAWATDVNIRVPDGGGPGAFINGICTEALNNSSNPEAPHGYGFNARYDGKWDLMGNIWSHNWKRNPRSRHPDVDIIWVNNYVWNWGKRLYHGREDEGPDIDWIGDVAEGGPDTDIGEGVFENNKATVYWEDNTLIPSDTPLNDGNVDYVDQAMNLPDGLSVSDLTPSSELADALVPSAGPRPADRPPQEQRIVDDFVNRGGEIIDHHDEVGGYPSYSPNMRSLNPPSTGVLDWVQQYTNEVE